MKKLLLLISLLSLCSTVIAASQLSYTDNGSGQAIVLLHAFPADHHLWDPQINKLSQHYRIITLDLLGFGNAKPTQGEAINMREYANQVNELLTQLRVDKAIIAGESMGGYISLAFLKAYPEKTAGLILSDTQAIADTDAQKVKREAVAKEVLENGTQDLITKFIPQAVSKNAPQEIKQQLEKMFSSQPATAIASALRGMSLREDTTAELARTTIPILIISGAEDQVIPTSESIKMHSQAQKSQLIIIGGAGHLSNIERPDEWNKAVLNFFK